MSFTFFDLARCTALVQNHHPQYPRLFNAFLYGSGLPGRQNVPVPLELGLEQPQSIDDLNPYYWIAPADGNDRYNDLARNRVTITKLSPNDIPSFALKYYYTIYYVDQSRVDLGQNICLSHAIPGFDKIWYGNILVVKHGRRNAVVSMTLQDSALVDAIVAMAIEKDLLV